jgi:hypothetical protein
MASKKKLKHNINQLVDLLITECLVYKLHVSELDMEEVVGLLNKLRVIRADFLSRANCPDAKSDRKLVKAYYRHLKDSLREKIGEVVKEMTYADEKTECLNK